MDINLFLALGLIAAALVIGIAVGFIIRKASAESKLGSAESAETDYSVNIFSLFCFL